MASPGQHATAPDTGTAPATPAAPTPEREPSTVTPAAPTPEREPSTASMRSSNQDSSSPVASATGDVEVLRRAWPEILHALSKIKRSTWALVEPNAQVASFDGQVVTLAFTTTGLAGAFGRADHAENLRQAVQRVVGIDAQLVASAGGARRTSSAPNPKAPASTEDPASASSPATSSVDEAWGLTSPTQQPAPAQEQGVAPAPQQAGSAAPQQAGPSSAVDDPTPDSGSDSRPGPSPEQPGSPAEPRTSGTSGYSDDDWGLPLDEDAPPLDEEPPLDWDPQRAGFVDAPAVSDHGAAAGELPSNAPGKGNSASSAAAPTSLSLRPTGSKDLAPAHRDPAQEPEVIDQWSRAVEQSPGIWEVGAESNVGTKGSSSQAGSAEESADDPWQNATPAADPAAGQSNQPAISPDVTASQPAPEYEPATAPMPASTGHQVFPVQAAAPVIDPWLDSAPAREPALSAVAATAAPAAASTARPQDSAAAARSRQSLYQRLSSSPEAEAGRAKAPIRSAVPTPEVQDVPSADDQTIEESGVFGRAAVERILGGKLVEERSPDGSPLPTRY